MTRIGAIRRGESVVVIPVYGKPDCFVRCLESVLHWTNPEVPVVVADDASPGDEITQIVEAAVEAAVSPRSIVHAKRAVNLGFVGNVNMAMTDVAPGDVVIVNSDVVVGPEWLERLRDAAYSSSRVATATAITNNGTICSVPFRNTGTAMLPQEWVIDKAAEAVARASTRAYPELPTAVGHCVYIRRDAIELVGPFDEFFSPGYSEEVDFSRRCVAQGLMHVLADDVLVEHTGNQSFGSETAKELAERNHAEILRRYPAYDRLVTIQCAQRSSPLGAALLRASVTLRGLSVTIDARCLSDIVTGTQVHALQVIRALDAHPSVRLRVLLPNSASDSIESDVSRGGRVNVIRESDVRIGVPRSDVVHRPFQLNMSEYEARVLTLLGERIVVTQQDLIAYHNPTYFPDPEAWFAYRDGTADALAFADFVLFFSQHARDDALASGLVEEHRTEAVYIGVDHRQDDWHATADASSRAPSGDYLVCIGTDFTHKNRPFALQVLRELNDNHGWDGKLVFLGPHVLHGSSAAAEAELLLRHPKLRDHVLDLGAVDDRERDVVIAGSKGVIYPTTFEGFGLVPFEAANLGVPCFFAPVTSVEETLGADLATIVPWSPSSTASAIHRIIDDEALADGLVDDIRQAGLAFTWSKTADGLFEAYTDVLALPPRPLRDITATAMMNRADEEYAATAVAFANHLPPDVAGPLLAVAKNSFLEKVYFFPLRLSRWVRRRPVA